MPDSGTDLGALRKRVLGTVENYCGHPAGTELTPDGDCSDCVRIADAVADDILLRPEPAQPGPARTHPAQTGPDRTALDVDALREEIENYVREHFRIRLSPHLRAQLLEKPDEPLLLSGGEADTIARLALHVIQPRLTRRCGCPDADRTYAEAEAHHLAEITHLTGLLAQKTDEIDDKSEMGHAAVAAWRQRAEAAERRTDAAHALLREALSIRQNEGYHPDDTTRWRAWDHHTSSLLDGHLPDPGYCPQCGRGDVTPTAQQRADQYKRAERAEAEREQYRLRWTNQAHAAAKVLALAERYRTAWWSARIGRAKERELLRGIIDDLNDALNHNDQNCEVVQVRDRVRALATQWAALAPPDDWADTVPDTIRADCGRAILTILDAPPSQTEPTELARLKAAITQYRAYLDGDFRFWASPDAVAGRYATALVEQLDIALSSHNIKIEQPEGRP